MYVPADSMSYFKPTNNFILNPHIGFQTFQRFNGDPLEPAETRRWTEGYPINYHPFTGSLSNGQHPDTTVAYYRVYWRYFEPEEGKYNWELFDKALATAEERKQTLMIRMPPHSHLGQPDEEIPDADDLPAWLRAKIGPKWHFSKDVKYDEKFLMFQGVSDPNHPDYIHYYTRAIKALADRYDNDPRLDSVDMSLCGAWGEEADLGHLTEENRNALIHAFTDNFKNTPVMAQSNQWELHSYACNVPAECDGRVETLRYIASLNARVGIRGDCLGDMSYRTDPKWNWGHMRSIYPYIFGAPGVADMWKRGPITFEAGGVMYSWLDMGFDLDEILEQGTLWHTSTFSNKGAPVPPEYRERVEKWCSQIGYRYAVRNVNYPGQAKGGDVLQIAMWLQNLGNSPMYRNYPFVLRLISPSGEVRHTMPVDIRDWLPGDITLRAEWTLPLYLPEDTYALQLGIVNPRNGQSIVRFACDAPCSDDGFVQVGQVRIVIPRA